MALATTSNGMPPPSAFEAGAIKQRAHVELMRLAIVKSAVTTVSELAKAPTKKASAVTKAPVVPRPRSERLGAKLKQGDRQGGGGSDDGLGVDDTDKDGNYELEDEDEPLDDEDGDEAANAFGKSMFQFKN